jgi:hypothetical protein
MATSIYVICRMHLSPQHIAKELFKHIPTEIDSIKYRSTFHCRCEYHIEFKEPIPPVNINALMIKDYVQLYIYPVNPEITPVKNYTNQYKYIMKTKEHYQQQLNHPDTSVYKYNETTHKWDKTQECPFIL